MRYQHRALHIFLNVAILAGSVAYAESSKGQTQTWSQSGLATYADLDSSDVHQPVDCQTDAARQGTMPAVSISSAHLMQRQDGCSHCILLAGTGQGIGALPVSTRPTKYLITHRCLDCAPHELEMSTPAEQQSAIAGQWAVSWSFASCEDEQPTQGPIPHPSPAGDDDSIPHDPLIRADPQPEEALAAAADEAGVPDARPAWLGSSEGASRRRLSGALHGSVVGDMAESLPSAAWLREAAAGSGSSVEGAVLGQKAMRRSLIAQDSGKHQRRLNLQGQAAR